LKKLTVNGREKLHIMMSSLMTILYLDIKDYVAFYANKMDACLVDDELVKAQAGGFYGGWITSNIVGPFKGSRYPAG
jgi:hypothetical protein